MSLSESERATVREIARMIGERALAKAVADGRAIRIESGRIRERPHAKVVGHQQGRVGDELLSRADVARIAGVGRSKSFEIWAQLDKIVLGGRCVRVRRADLDRYFDEVRRRAWR